MSYDVLAAGALWVFIATVREDKPAVGRQVGKIAHLG